MQIRCEICGRDINSEVPHLRDVQFINGCYYHNSCIEQLTVIYKLEQKIVSHSEVQLEMQLDKWNKLKERIERRIKSYEDREKLGKGYELTEVMQITLACDRRFLETMEEIEEE